MRPLCQSIIAILLAAILCACGLASKPISFSDPELRPFLKAVGKVDRASLGFNPIDTNSVLRLETATGRAYDAMLHIYGNGGESSRTIAFRKTPDGFRWIAEQEIHTGPHWH